MANFIHSHPILVRTLCEAVPAMGAGGAISSLAFGLHPTVGVVVGGVTFLVNTLVLHFFKKHREQFTMRVDRERPTEDRPLNFSGMLLHGGANMGGALLAQGITWAGLGMFIPFPHVFLIAACSHVAVPLGTHAYQWLTRG